MSYANAFLDSSTRISEFASDHADMTPGVYERQYELDSPAKALDKIGRHCSASRSSLLWTYARIYRESKRPLAQRPRADDSFKHE